MFLLLLLSVPLIHNICQTIIIPALISVFSLRGGFNILNSAKKLLINYYYYCHEIIVNCYIYLIIHNNILCVRNDVLFIIQDINPQIKKCLTNESKREFMRFQSPQISTALTRLD